MYVWLVLIAALVVRGASASTDGDQPFESLTLSGLVGGTFLPISEHPNGPITGSGQTMVISMSDSPLQNSLQSQQSTISRSCVVCVSFSFGYPSVEAARAVHPLLEGGKSQCRSTRRPKRLAFLSRMFRAAFVSRSIVVPQCPQWNILQQVVVRLVTQRRATGNGRKGPVAVLAPDFHEEEK